MPSAEITVLIPTFRRPEAFAACLAALAEQTRPADAVVVVIRPEDEQSRQVADRFSAQLPIEVAEVLESGQVQALNRGLASVTTPLVAITDDDARPRPHWLDRIIEHFEDSTVGAVGGRDIVHHGLEIEERAARHVGRIHWYGRVVGNHHLNAPLQEVQFLKGANMSYRREALLGFDERLAGRGAQTHNDLQASLRVHAAGWRVIWDPAVAVDHFPAERFDDEQRGRANQQAAVNWLHNQTYVLLSLLRGWPRVSVFLYGLVVGTRARPGLLLLPLAIGSHDSVSSAMAGFRVNLSGRMAGFVTFRRSRGRPQIPPGIAAFELKGAPRGASRGA